MHEQHFKDDFQSVLRTLKSMFTSFVLFHERSHKMWIFCNYLHKWNSKFHVNRHYGCEALWFLLSCIAWWNNFAAVEITHNVGKTIWKASKIAFHLVRLRVLRLRSTLWKSSLTSFEEISCRNEVTKGIDSSNMYKLLKWCGLLLNN